MHEMSVSPGFDAVEEARWTRWRHLVGIANVMAPRHVRLTDDTSVSTALRHRRGSDVVASASAAGLPAGCDLQTRQHGRFSPFWNDLRRSPFCR